MIRFGLQSYTIRELKTPEAVVSAMKMLGLEWLEMWPGHLAHDDDAAKTALWEDALQAAGIRLSSYGLACFNSDESISRAIFEFAAKHGMQTVTASVSDDSLELNDRLSSEYGIRLAIHNHGRDHVYGTRAALETLLDKTSDNFGLCLDAGWFIDVNDDPIRIFRDLKERVYGIHLKDFAYPGGKREDVTIGDGSLDVAGFLRTVYDSGWTGYLSIEYEGNPDNPVPEVIKAVERVNAVG